MKNKQPISTKKESIKDAVTATETVAKIVIPKSNEKLNFLLKVFGLLLVVAGIVAYCDSKEYFVGDQINNHTERKWRSFYRFREEQKNADIVVFGNSHASAGIEPYIVSMATGTYCFILNTPGSTAIDAYFNLKEILNTGNKPKLAIVESSCLNFSEVGLEWGRIQSFEAKKNSLQKLMSIGHLFKPDEWIKTISSTIRNHNFLLTDSARLAFNMANVGEIKNPDRSNFDLGRFSHGQNHLKDSTIAKYANKDLIIKCAERTMSEENREYVLKLYELCKANDVELMLFTAPMYYKTFDNYSIQKKKNLDFFKVIPSYKWLDCQDPYDSVKYSVLAFNDECHGLQHNTYYGMTINSYNLSKFILDNYGSILPKKQNDPVWIKDFSFTDLDFAINHDVVPAMTSFSVIAKNQTVGKFTVNEMVCKTSKEGKILLLKINDHPDLKTQIRAVLTYEMNGQQGSFPVTLSQRTDVFPPTYKAYFANVSNDAKFINLLSLQE